MFFVVPGLKNDGLANDTFFLAQLVEVGQSAARQNDVSHFRNANIECRNNLLAIIYLVYTWYILCLSLEFEISAFSSLFTHHAYCSAL